MLAAIRIATYNVENNPANATEDGFFNTVLEGIGNQTQAGVTRPVDLLVLQETDSTSASRLEAILDSLYSDDYVRVTSNSYFGDRYGFIYNTATLNFLGSTNVTGSFVRPPLRGHFEPIGATSSDADFYVYSAHLKADDQNPFVDRSSTRASEASQIRADADALGEGENILIVGDFNMKNSFEGGFTNLTAVGNGQVLDPVNQLGNWFNNSAFKSVHTQDPGGGGGMDDRFDLQFISGELQTSGGLDYVSGSYRVYGNNGTHALNGLITSGSAETATIRSALANASDHLPVVVDYEFQSVPPGATLTETDNSTIVAENSYLDSYAVALDTDPVADVTVTLTPDSQVDLGAGPGVAIPLVFTPLNAQTPQTVTVMAADDLVSEGNHISTITHSFSSTDTDYNALASLNLDVLVVDNEAPSILINEVDAVPTGNLEFIELYDGGIGNSSLIGKTLVLFDGGTDTSYAAFDLDGFTTNDSGLFTVGNSGVNGVDLIFANGLLRDGADAVALYADDASSFPNGTIVTTTNLVDAVVYDTDDVDDNGLLPLLLVGEPQVNENENGTQATESNSRLPDGGLARRTSSVSATTPTPDSLNTPRPVGFTVLGADGIEVTEGGATDSYTIALTSVPAANVVVTIDPDADLDLGSGSGSSIDLTFTPANAMSPQTVIVTGFDDAFAEGLHGGLIQHSVASGDGAYDSLTLDDIIATITDNEPPPPPSMVISEIMYNPASTGEGTAFSPEWVELVNTGTAPQDISGWRLSDEDGDWGVIPASTIVQPGQVVVLFDGASSAITTETGFRNTWGIPAGALVIGVDWDEELDNDPSPTEGVLELLDPLLFVQDVVNYDDDDPSATDWPSDDPEGPSIYLTNLLADNNVGTNWARSAVGVDDGKAASGFPFSVSDVGSPGFVPAIVTGDVIVTESNSSTDVVEGGTGDNFTIVLDSTPASDVVVTLTPDAELDLGAGAGVAIDRIFTTANALTPVNIAVTANNDLIDEAATHTGLVSFSTSSSDPAFDNLVIADLSVNVTDNDTAGVTVVESGGSTNVTEGGVNDDFTLVLDTIPTGNVAVTITPDGQLDLGSGQGVAITRVFTSVDALTPQGVTVIAFNDTANEGAHSGVITFSVASTDTNYDGLTPSNVTANITDNDSTVLVDLFGEQKEYVGFGLYEFQFFVQASGGQAVTIDGFTIPMVGTPGVSTVVDPPPPGGSLSDIAFTPNPLLEAKGSSSDFGAFGFSITANDLNGSPLVIAAGATELLFSIEVNVASGFVPEDVLSLVAVPPLSSLLDVSTPGGSMTLGNGLVGIGAPARLIDNTPIVTDIKVAGAAWSDSGAFANFLAEIDPTDGIGYSLLAAPAVLPWINVDTIHIEFSEDIGSFEAADFSLNGVPVGGAFGGPVGDYELAGLIPAGNITYDSAANRATLVLTTPFLADKLRLNLFAAGIEDAAGNKLDGDANGTGGDDFEILFDVLPGDKSGNGAVSASDVSAVQELTGTIQGLPGYDPFSDLNGNGSVTATDVSDVQSRTGTFLPFGTPGGPSLLFGPSTSSNRADEGDVKNRWFLVDEVFRNLEANFVDE